MFPSFSDLQFLHSMGVLTPDQVKMYFNGGAINAQQAQSLGFSPAPVQPKQAVNTQPASSSASASAKPAQTVKPSVNPTVQNKVNPTAK